MEGLVSQQQQPTFPRTGSNYAPLPRGKGNGRVLAHAVQTIRATPEQVFHVYSRPELLPTWQEGVISVTSTGENTLHWSVQDPGTGTPLDFDSEILEAIPGKRHVSRVTSGPFESTTVTLTFEEEPNGRGTVVTLVNDFRLPGGVLANAVGAFVSRSPEQSTIENLRHLKQLMESREIPNVEGQPAGPRGVIGKWKQFLMGENMPKPPGTSDRARPQDMPIEKAGSNPLLLGSVAALVGLATWSVVRRLR